MELLHVSSVASPKGRNGQIPRRRVCREAVRRHQVCVGFVVIHHRSTSTTPAPTRFALAFPAFANYPHSYQRQSSRSTPAALWRPRCKHAKGTATGECESLSRVFTVPMYTSRRPEGLMELRFANRPTLLPIQSLHAYWHCFTYNIQLTACPATATAVTTAPANTSAEAAHGVTGPAGSSSASSSSAQS